MRPMPNRLYHFTCADGAAGILRDGVIRPNLHPLLGWAVVWLTDMEVPDRAALGLIPSERVPCDRAEYRFEVAPGGLARCVWWPRFARILPRAVRSAFEYGLEGEHPGDCGRPAHWWVATEPVPFVPEGSHRRERRPDPAGVHRAGVPRPGRAGDPAGAAGGRR